MLISAISTKAVIGIIIAIVAVQYGIALFCLLKLAYLDLTKKEYVLWNLFILLVFFIGDIAFLIYYSKVKDTKRIPPYVPSEDNPSDEATAAEATEETPAEEDNN